MLKQQVGHTIQIEYNNYPTYITSNSPTIQQPMDVDVEAPVQINQQASTSIYKAPTSLTYERRTEQRRNQAMKRRKETAMNHRGEVFKQAKLTIAQQILNIQPPRVAPQFIPIASPSDEEMLPAKVPTKRLSNPNATIPASSNQAPAPMDASPEARVPGDPSSEPKRGTPETEVEPKGKAERPIIKYVDLRPDAEKREGDEMPEYTGRKKPNRNKEKQRMILESKMEKAKAETSNADDEEEEPKPRKGSRVRSTIQKPIIPSKVGIQPMYEAFNNAPNKNIITKEEFEEFNEIFKEYRKAKGKDTSKYTKQARELYRKKLYHKLKKNYEDDV